MKNRISDLNNHLFETLERLNDPAMTSEQLATEVSRARAVATVAKEVVAAGQLVLDAAQLSEDSKSAKIPKVLLDKDNARLD